MSEKDYPMADSDRPAQGLTTEEQLYGAVKYTLDRIQEDPNLRYYAGYSTQVFYLLVRAEAAYLGQPLAEVEADRRRDLQPHYRKTQPDVIRLRHQLDELRAECGL